MAARLVAAFEAAGASRIEPGYLQSAEILLDLYGEDIRARAYTTHDPVHGEQMLRPDFTVPVVRTHMAERREPARYTYAGPVWRRQDYGSTKAREYWQVGYEIFDGSDPAGADAEVFSLIAQSLDGVAAPLTGDLAFLFAAIEALKTTDARKAALRRHVWRPKRFQRLLDRYSGTSPFDCDTRELPDRVDGTHLGVRTIAEVEARLAVLRAERETPDLSSEEVAFLQSVLAIKGGSAASLEGLRAIARSFPTLGEPVDHMTLRLEALEARGVDAQTLPFDASFGRTSMEYYDGFVFAFGDVATGGRYDALTRVLGDGTPVPAVGGVIRPAVLEALA